MALSRGSIPGPIASSKRSPSARVPKASPSPVAPRWCPSGLDGIGADDGVAIEAAVWRRRFEMTFPRPHMRSHTTGAQPAVVRNVSGLPDRRDALPTDCEALLWALPLVRL